MEDVKENTSVKVWDSDENLTLKSSSDPREGNFESMNCRGFVYDSESNLISRSLPFAVEKSTLEREFIEKYMEKFDTVKFYLSLEGTVLRMFHYGGKWYLTTNKKLDAFQSKWIDELSFGDLFVNSVYNGENQRTTFEDLQLKLDKTKTYIFLTTSSMFNRSVCFQHGSCKTYHVGTYSSDFSVFDTEDNVGVVKMQPLSFETVTLLCNFVSYLNPSAVQGVIAFFPDGHQLKVLNEQYHFLSEVRGNEYDVGLRYIQIRGDSQKNQALRSIYDNRQFDFIEQMIYNLGGELYDIYRSRYIFKYLVTVDYLRHRILKNLHEWHKENRDTNIITIDTVRKSINDFHPTCLNKLIKSTHV
jgi:hypothetical protein